MNVYDIKIRVQADSGIEATELVRSLTLTDNRVLSVGEWKRASIDLDVMPTGFRLVRLEEEIQPLIQRREWLAEIADHTCRRYVGAGATAHEALKGAVARAMTRKSEQVTV